MLKKLNLDVKSERKENGKLMTRLSKTCSRIFSPSSSSEFKCNKTNMFLTELKVNSPKEESRKFVISIRLDGHKENEGETRLTQMGFNEEELIELRNQINNLLEDKVE